MKTIYEMRGNEFIPHDFIGFFVILKTVNGIQDSQFIYVRTEREKAMINDMLTFIGAAFFYESREELAADQIANLAASANFKDISKDWSVMMGYEEAKTRFAI